MSNFARPGRAVSLEDALTCLLACVRPIAPRTIALGESLGCVLARPVVAAADVPPFATAAMDGYAVRAQDAAGAPSRLMLAGAITAGPAAAVSLRPGQAMAITTGSPVPEGADAVCRAERAHADDCEVVLEAPVAAGENIRRVGEDITRGSEVFEASTVLGPAHVGVLASLGVTEVLAYPRARVGVLSTGAELREGAGALRPGEIRDSNRHALLALVTLAGCLPVDLGIVTDDPEAISATVARAGRSCDVILTSGGVSVGATDHMKSVLGRLSEGNTQWMEVALRPGKPFGLAVLSESGTPVLCLPGSPAAALVSFELLARPALRQLTGHPYVRRAMLAATADERLTSGPGGGLHVLRVVARSDDDGCLRVRAAGGQGSYHLRSMALANALAYLPEGVGVEAGQVVRITLLDADSPQPSGAWS